MPSELDKKILRANLPYGTKTQELVASLSDAIIERLSHRMSWPPEGDDVILVQSGSGVCFQNRIGAAHAKHGDAGSSLRELNFKVRDRAELIR